jgi:hypothetical protein
MRRNASFLHASIVRHRYPSKRKPTDKADLRPRRNIRHYGLIVLKNSVAAKFSYYMRDLAKLQYNMWWPKAPLGEFFNTIGSKPSCGGAAGSVRRDRTAARRIWYVRPSA